MSDPKTPPSEVEVQALIGVAYSHFVTFVDGIRGDVGPLRLDWKYYKPTGWFKNGMVKRKRVFLFIPREGGFIFRMVFNERAIAMIGARGFPDSVIEGLDEARQYPEGKPFDLDETSFDSALAARLVDVKLQSMKRR